MAKLSLSGGDSEAKPAQQPTSPSSAPPPPQTPSSPSSSASAATPTTTSPPSMLSQRVLANMSPAERPKAKPSRKGDGKAGKKAAAVQQLGGPAAQQQQQQQGTHPLQQLAHLKQMNQRLHQQVQQQKKMKPTENQVGIQNSQFCFESR